MKNRAIRVGMMLWLAGCFCHAVCQSAATATTQPQRASYEVYESFLRRIALQKDAPADAPIDAPVLLNGQPVKPALPDLRDVAGLRDQDVQRLREIAADCEAKTESLTRIAGPLTFDYLMEAIQSGQDQSGPLQQRLKDLQDQRDQVVREHIEQIKIAVGDSRFEKLDTFVRAPKPARLPPGITIALPRQPPASAR